MWRAPIGSVVALLAVCGCALDPAVPHAQLPGVPAPSPLAVSAGPSAFQSRQDGRPGPPPAVVAAGSLSPALQPVAEAVVATLVNKGESCVVERSKWLFPGAGAGASIRCEGGTIQLFHYADTTGGEWSAARQDFTPASWHGYANQGVVMVNYRARHDLDATLYALLDNA